MGLLLAVAAALGLERTIKEGADYFASLHRSDIMMTIKEGNWPAGRRGWPALEQWGGVDLLLVVTLFVEADEMLSEKIKNKKWNFVEQTNDRMPMDVAGDLGVTWRGRVAWQTGWGVSHSSAIWGL